jgi:penicillin amidase
MADQVPRGRGFGPDFRYLWTATIISGVGDGMRVTAFALFAAALTRNALLVSVVTVAGQFPAICVGPFAGVLVDRLDRRRMLWMCDAARAIALGGFVTLVLAGDVDIALLACVAFFMGAAETTAYNLSQAIVPDLADSSVLGAANSRLQGGQFVTSQFLGLPLGGALFAVSAAIPFSVDSVSFALSGALIFCIRSPSRIPAGSPRLTVKLVTSQTAEGMRWLAGHRVLRATCVLIGLSNLAVLGVLAIAVLYALEILHVSGIGYGVLLAVIAIGGLLGLLVAPRLAARLGTGRALQVAFALCPLSFLVGGLTSDAAVAAIAFMFVGASVSIGNVVTTTLRQVLIPRHMFGRVNGAYRLVVGGMAPLGGLIGGVAAHALGLRAPFFIGAGLLLAATAASFGLLSNHVVDPLMAQAQAQAQALAQAQAEAEPQAGAGARPGARPPEHQDAATQARAKLASRVGRLVTAVAATCVSAALLAFLAFGAGPLPALGPALDPGRGVWLAASGALVPRSQVLDLPGLRQPVTISFTSAGLASVRAASDADLYLALGYLHARFRLTQMDLERRLGAGRLAQLVGQPAVSSDRFELRLGLLRTAMAEWAQTPRGSQAGRALIAYARGVNDWLGHLRATGDWPSLYTLTGVRPAPWTPVDSLVVQEVLTQDLDFSTVPLDYELLERHLGAQRTMQWFPVLAPDAQRPYDPGPYRDLGVSPLAGNANAASPAGAAGQPDGQGARPAVAGAGVSAAAEASAATALLSTTAALPAGAVHYYPDSNAWAADGPAVAGGRAILAGDPHLLQTLPSYWFEVALHAPGTQVSGASLPGVPGILLGRNQHIAWSLTNAENQSTIFYAERTSRRHPGEYFWRGAWRRMRTVRYQIPVRGGRTIDLTVDLTVHGPVLTTDGITTSVDWMGDIPSPDLAVILKVDHATDFRQFSQALSQWRAPSQNFVYADDRGNIGAISAGYYPQVATGTPWVPLPGTGAFDVTGTIPYAAVPHVYDPPGHVLATANQRPVGPSYPYYIGTTLDSFDYGYRADQIYSYLTHHQAMTAADFAALQQNLTDHLATLIVPRLLSALADGRLSPREKAARSVLARWNYSMTTTAAGASIWWTFWTKYLDLVFKPWWSGAKVPVQLDVPGLSVSTDLASLDEDLEHWTLADPANPAFSPPGEPGRTAADVMRSAFAAAVSSLTGRLGSAPAAWKWGRLHEWELQSLTQSRPLGYGPVPSGGDPWTIDAADGGMTSDFGPSWRMIVSWAGPGRASAQAVYPGGQSENPASPWYENLISYWRSGRYLKLAWSSPGGSIKWKLRPAGRS